MPIVSDLVPKANVEAWMKYLRNELPTVAFKASTQEQNQKLVDNDKRPIAYKNAQKIIL